MARSETESRIAAFLAKYEKDMATRLRAARKKLRALFPRGFEQVYDSYNGLGFGIGSTDRSSGVVVSVLGYPRWITLFFLHGAGLKDPRGLLQGSGSRVRSIRLEHESDLDRPEVLALIEQAAGARADEFAAAPRLTTIIKSVVARQSSRRPRPGGAPSQIGARGNPAEAGENEVVVSQVPPRSPANPPCRVLYAAADESKLVRSCAMSSSSEPTGPLAVALEHAAKLLAANPAAAAEQAAEILKVVPNHPVAVWVLWAAHSACSEHPPRPRPL
ncbi:MAG: hypothetical protein WDO56_10325 [Gammaproteobacteria bacterium]